ncbi:MAG: ABC transporter permease [Lachnospiraceae bacterium]|nr:ABC transporter permease [Lachnospiraceae bacterium]
MIGRLINNEIKNQKLLSVSTVIFMAVSSMLMVLSLTLFVNLLGSVSNLMEEAKTPDYLQMHAGEMEEQELICFAGEHPEIEAWQISRFLNLDNNSLFLGEENLVGNTQDNGLCVQGEQFDYLLDMDNEIPVVHPGEVYVPVCYRQMYDLSVGDIMTMGEEQLEIAGFLRDSQMNSMMASSKRFLVCAEDYDRLTAVGSQEYLIEYRLTEGSDLDAFAAEYSKAGLPSNGPAITKALIKLMNALSDGIMIFVIFLVGISILLISLLCIGYITSLGVERDRKEAGMLKALGISNKKIRGIYLAKYILFAGVGGGLGFGTALLLSKPLGRSLKELYGPSPQGAVTVGISLVICILIQLCILLCIRRILKKNEKITVVEALFHGRDFRGKSEKSQMVMIGLVTALCAMLSLIPQNLYTTLAAPEFVSYMGIGTAELRMDIRQSEDIENRTQAVVETMEEDADIKEYVALKTTSCAATVSGGEQIHLLVETGDHSVFPVSYTEGREPVKEGEIALSVLQAADLEVGLEDSVSVGNEQARVCGLYSDITNGGKTAKMCVLPKTCRDTKPMWSILYVTLTDPSEKEQWVSRYREYGAEVVDIAEYVQATYGPTIHQVDRAKTMALGIAVVIVFVVVLLFVSLLLEKNRWSISLQKALGFKTRDIRRQYMKKAILPILMGMTVGAVMAMLLGQGICCLALQSLGASGFQFVVSMTGVMLVVGSLIMTGFLAVFAGTDGMKRIMAYECCRGKE